jgi:hypothetical protein
MKKYIVIIILAALIVSCGGKTEVVKEPKSFSFSNDFDGLINEIHLINTHTLIKSEENNNTYSSINQDKEYSFGVEFSSNLITDFYGIPTTVSARIRKEEINSDASLVFSCAKGEEVIVWESIKIDSNYVNDTNQWVNFSYSGFTVPESTPENTSVKFYFWTLDGKRVDIDDFKFEIEDY